MQRTYQAHEITVRFIAQTGMYGFEVKGMVNSRDDAAGTTVFGALQKARTEIVQGIEAMSRKQRIYYAV